MRNFILPALIALFFVAGCKKNSTLTPEVFLLNNTKWKTFNTTREFPNGFIESNDSTQGGIYLILNGDKTYTQTLYLFGAETKGTWCYKADEKKLLLTYKGGDNVMYETAYTVQNISDQKLILYIENPSPGFNGPVKTTIELDRY